MGVRFGIGVSDVAQQVAERHGSDPKKADYNPMQGTGVTRRPLMREAVRCAIDDTQRRALDFVNGGQRSSVIAIQEDLLALHPS